MALGLGAKIGVGAVVAGALAFLIFSDKGEGVLEYAHVEQVTADPDHYQGRKFQVYGKVVKGSVKKKKGTQGDYRFTIENKGERLAVHFTGVTPDTFMEEGEVILTGKLSASGDLIESDTMSAKCPSKYENEAKVSVDGKGPPKIGR